jgi:type IV pilus assembly protein PilV
MTAMKTSHHRQRLSRALRLGYTAAEVMMAITLFAIGGSGVIAMERAAIQGNVDARRMDQANAIANEWADRLSRETSLWGSQPPRLPVASMPMLSAGYVQAYPGWTNPPIPSSPTVGLSPAFDINGEEIVSGGTGPQPVQTIFCVQYQLQQLQSDPTRGGAPVLYRATVAVWWRRDLSPISVAPLCGNAGFAPTQATHKAVYVTQMIRENG